MNRSVLILGAIAGLTLATSAAAFDETRDETFAPGLHFSVSFGGSTPAKVSSPMLHDDALALYENAAAGSSHGLTKGQWIAIGVVAVVVIAVVASSGGGGGGGGGGGY